jgi:hypothetical protein
MLDAVIKHLQQQVEVFGLLHRNPRGEPILMEVEEFHPLEPTKTVPSIEELSGLVSDLYEGKSLKEHLEELRDA